MSCIELCIQHKQAMLTNSLHTTDKVVHYYWTDIQQINMLRIILMMSTYTAVPASICSTGADHEMEMEVDIQLV